jgi:hypothetical protein
MKIIYTFDPVENMYFARGDNDKGYISEGNKSLYELMHTVNDCVEMLYEETAEEYNKLQESNGSFSRYTYPKAEFIKVELDTFDEY